MFAQLIAFAVQTAATLKAHQGGDSIGNPKDYLTNPTTGLQTKAGKALADIIAQYSAIKAAGGNSPAVVQATVDGIETVRAAFETKVKEFGPLFWIAAGRGGVDTINSVAAKLTADRAAELAGLAGSPAEVQAAGGAGGNSILILFVVVVGVLLLAGKR